MPVNIRHVISSTGNLHTKSSLRSSDTYGGRCVIDNKPSTSSSSPWTSTRIYSTLTNWKRFSFVCSLIGYLLVTSTVLVDGAKDDLFSNSFLVRFKRDVTRDQARHIAEKNGFSYMGPVN